MDCHPCLSASVGDRGVLLRKIGMLCGLEHHSSWQISDGGRYRASITFGSRMLSMSRVMSELAILIRKLVPAGALREVGAYTLVRVTLMPWYVGCREFAERRCPISTFETIKRAPSEAMCAALIIKHWRNTRKCSPGKSICWKCGMQRAHWGGG